MKIKTLIDSLAANAITALPHYNVFTGTKQYFEQTQKNLPDKIMVIEPPEKFMVNFFQECQVKQEITCYVGWKVQINEVSQSLAGQSFIFDEMNTDINLFCREINGDNSYYIYEDSENECFNPEKGETVNNYAYIKFTLKIRVNG